MTALTLLPFVAAVASLILAGVSLVRKTPTVATRCFAAGMAALAIDGIVTGIAFQSAHVDDAAWWLNCAFVVKSMVPAIWLGFALTYSRSEAAFTLSRWRLVLIAAGLLPLAISIGFTGQLFEIVPGELPDDGWRVQFGAWGKALNAVILLALVLVLMNLEQTFRAAVGTMRWRLKYVVLGLIVIFGTSLYVRSQAILYSAPAIGLWNVESGALLLGCVFLTIAYARTGWTEAAVYPSATILRSSVTLLIVGGYLLGVGLLAQLVARIGQAEFFQLQAFVVLLGMAGLALFLLSDRARQRIQIFVGRHFTKSQHDSVKVWTTFSQRLANVADQTALCRASARLLAETFDVLSVSIWLLDDEMNRFVLATTTATVQSSEHVSHIPNRASEEIVAGLADRSKPFDLDGVGSGWADELRRRNPGTFAAGGHRFGLPLRAGDRILGVIVLADRINGATYTLEELDLLRCTSDQIASILVNLRLGAEVARARELDAFRTMSTFFVHDLKNAASSLHLMLQNAPAHFDDPGFRRDALKAIGNTARRIDEMTARLSSLRDRPEAVRVKEDLNELVNKALDQVHEPPDVELTRDLHPVPTILADREQIQSVVTNLVLNASQAIAPGGRIKVRTEHRGDRAILSVSDNGCGMTATYMQESLFRPFQSTKKQGLGIGLFQSRAIVHAHGGVIQVESEVGKGTTFVASFPVTES